MTPLHRLDNTALDRWLQRSLREHYSATLREPVPDALVKLLDAEPPTV